MSVFFVPAPLIQTSASESAWGNHGVVVTHPEPLKNTHFEARSAYRRPHHLASLRPILLLTARLNRVHSIKAAPGCYQVAPDPQSSLTKTMAPLVVAKGQCPWTFLSHLAVAGGIPTPRWRSDRAWVGGKSPKDAQIALPAASMVQGLMDDYIAFLSEQIANPSEEVDEAAAYQLLSIHPLSDGNGRLVRALLIKLAMQKQAMYPLYLAWGLMFAKLHLFECWRSNSMAGRPSSGDTSYPQWSSGAASIVDAYETAAFSLDRRALDAFLLYGMVTQQSILPTSRGISPRLAGKIEESYRNAANAMEVTRFESAIDRGIKNCKASIEIPTTK